MVIDMLYVAHGRCVIREVSRADRIEQHLMASCMFAQLIAYVLQRTTVDQERHIEHVP